MAVDSSANIGIRVFLDNVASAGLRDVNYNLQAISRSASDAGDSFGKMMQTGLLLGFLASFAMFGLAIKDAVKNAIDLQTAMTNIGIATGMTKSQLAELQPFLLNLGGSSIFSIDQLAKGMQLLGQYGFKTVASMEAVSTAGTNLAEAVGVEPVQAFKALAAVMQAYGLPASQAANVSDLLFYSMQHGTPDIANMQAGLSAMAGTADKLHQPLITLLPAFDTLSKAMGSASQAGTAIAYMLQSMTSPLPGQAAEMEKLGLSYYDASGNFIGFDAALRELQQRLQGMNLQDKLAALQLMFNMRSGKGMGILLQDLGLVNAEEQALIDKGAALGGAQKAADAIMSTGAGLWKAFGTNLTDISALIGTSLIPIIKSVTGFLLLLSQRMRDLASHNSSIMSSFLLLGFAISAVGAIIMLAMTPIGAIVLVILATILVVSMLSAGLDWLIVHWRNVSGIVAVVVDILKKVALAILGVGAVIAGIVIAPFIVSLLMAAAGLSYLGVAAVGHAIPALIKLAAQVLLTMGRGIAYAVMNWATLIPSILATVGAWLASAAAAALAALPYILLAVVIAGAIIGLVLVVRNLGFLHVFLTLVTQAWKAILPAILAAGAAIRGAFMQALTALHPLWLQLVAAFTMAQPILLFLGKVLGGIIVVAIGILIGAIRAIIAIFAVLLVTAIHIVVSVIQIFTGIIQFFTGLFTIVRGIFTGNTKLISEGWTMLWNGVVNVFKGIVNIIINLFKGFFSAIINGVKGFIDGIISFFAHLFSALVGHSIIPDMIMSIVSFFLGLGPKLLGIILSLIGNIIGLFVGFANKVLSIIWGWITGMVGFVGGLVGKLISALGIGNFLQVFIDLPGKILGALAHLAGDLWNFGAHIIQQFIDGIGSALGGLWNTISNIAGNIAKFLGFSGPPPLGALHTSDQWMPHMIEMMSSSAKKAMPTVHAMSADIAGGIAASGAAPRLSTSGSTPTGGAASSQFVINLDGKVIYDSMQVRMRNTLQAQGASRVLR